MAGNLKTKQNQKSYNNAIRQLNKNDVSYNSDILYQIRLIVARELNLLTVEAMTSYYLRNLKALIDSMGTK